MPRCEKKLQKKSFFSLLRSRNNEKICIDTCRNNAKTVTALLRFFASLSRCCYCAVTAFCIIVTFAALAWMQNNTTSHDASKKQSRKNTVTNQQIERNTQINKTPQIDPTHNIIHK